MYKISSKSNKNCERRSADRQTYRQKDESYFIICPMLCDSNHGTDNKHRDPRLRDSGSTVVNMTSKVNGTVEILCDTFPFISFLFSCRRLQKQESRAVARKPRDAAAVVFGLKFAYNIHYKFKSSQASKARLQGSNNRDGLSF